MVDKKKHPINDLPDIRVIEDILVELSDIIEYDHHIFTYQFFYDGSIDVYDRKNRYKVCFHEVDMYQYQSLYLFLTTNLKDFYSMSYCEIIENRYEVFRDRYILCIKIKEKYLKDIPVYNIMTSDKNLMEVIYQLRDYLGDDYLGIKFNDENKECHFEFNTYTYNKI